MADYYILDGKTKQVFAATLEQWTTFLHSKDYVVKQDTVDDAWVSTVCLGLDMGLFEGPPLVFETMVFRGMAEYQERCATYEQALKQHAEAIAWVKRQRLTVIKGGKSETA